MENAMYVDYLTKTCGHLTKGKSGAGNNGKPECSFMDKLIEKSEQSEQIKEISKINVVEKDFVKDMTMEEYKQYIYDQIAKIPISDSQMNSSFSVYITEEGFEAMKNNPEY